MNSIVASLKTLFGLSGDPRTISEALDAAEIDPGGVLPETVEAVSDTSEANICAKVENGDWKQYTSVLLPKGSNTNRNKYPRVNNYGVWVMSSIPEGLPAVTASDNGKILKVVDGAWAVAAP